jgi:hypothetical protein
MLLVRLKVSVIGTNLFARWDQLTEAFGAGARLVEIKIAISVPSDFFAKF